jgi:hypothetical protein
VLQMTAPIAPGSSGGPAMNERGQVIGVVTALSTNAQNVAFAVPAAYVQRLLGSSKTRLELAEFAARTESSGEDRAGRSNAASNIPSTIAGFQLGMTLEHASAICNGELKGTPVEATCPFSPVRVPFASGDVHLELDAGFVTSVRIHALSWPLAREALSERYGAPTGFATEVKGGWMNADSFDPARPSVALWQLPGFDILVTAHKNGIDIKYTATFAQALRSAAY